MTKRGMLIILSGPSGVGKDTLIKNYLLRNPNSVLSVSTTTRPPRAGEKEGVDYFFVDIHTFHQSIKDGRLLEYAEYGGNYYGTIKAQVDQQLNAGKDVILIIEVVGAKKIKAELPETLTVFLLPPSPTCLEQRLKSRNTDDGEMIKKRLEAAKAEMETASTYDYVIVNDNLDTAVENFSLVVTAAKFSPKHVSDLLKGACLNDA